MYSINKDRDDVNQIHRSVIPKSRRQSDIAHSNRVVIYLYSNAYNCIHIQYDARQK